MYLNETKNKVEVFLKKRRISLQSEVQYLGEKKMQVSYATLKEILDDLVIEKKVRREKIHVGKKVFIEIRWLKVV
jgi:hypothetical protein